MNRAALGSCAERRIGFTPDSMILTFTLSICSVAGLCSLLTGAAVDSIGERLCRSDWVGEHFLVINVASRCLGWQGRLGPQRAIGRVGSDSPLIQFSMANIGQVFHPLFLPFLSSVGVYFIYKLGCLRREIGNSTPSETGSLEEDPLGISMTC